MYIVHGGTHAFCDAGGGTGGGTGPRPGKRSPVACAGTPASCPNIPCNGSQLAIGSVFQYDYRDVTVTDINTLFQQTAVGSEIVGWIYKGSNGARYIQGDLANSYGVQFSISLGFVSAGISSASGYTAIQHYSGNLPVNTGAAKCETSGGATLA